MKYCKVCIIPITRPDQFFDNNNVCNACRSHQSKTKIDWNKRLDKFKEIIDKFKTVDGCADHYYQKYWVEKNQRTQKKIDDFVKYEFNKALKNKTGPFKPSENTGSLREQLKDFDNYKKKIRDFQNFPIKKLQDGHF